MIIKCMSEGVESQSARFWAQLLQQRKNCPIRQFFVSGIGAIPKEPEILEESIDQDGPNHQQAHPDKGPMEEGGFEGDHAG